MAQLTARLRAQGRQPYVIPGGGSNAIGALGYVTCALELAEQANNAGLAIDTLVTATGSAGTQAGLVAGLEGARAAIRCSASACARRKRRRKRRSSSWPRRRPNCSAWPAR